MVATCLWMDFYPDIDEGKETTVLSIYWLLIGGAFIITFVSLLNLFLDKFLTWKKHPGIRFFVQMILGTAFSLACLNLSYFIIRAYYNTAKADPAQLIVMNLYGAALILPIFSLYFGFQFLKDWRKSEIESERLLKENARSQMMSLKNHLDPHFLFNNLNILSSLMDKDVDLSKEYLDKFAEVYRIILKAEHSDLTLLEEEIKLIDSYVYLLKIRFGESVFFNIDLADAALEKALPPLSIQMLIENAIKHNMASEQKPITINIYSKDPDHLIIENNIQKKTYPVQERKGTGLENIKNRYQFFSDLPVVIEETTERFKVTLPLIEIEYN